MSNYQQACERTLRVVRQAQKNEWKPQDYTDLAAAVRNEATALAEFQSGTGYVPKRLSKASINEQESARKTVKEEI